MPTPSSVAHKMYILLRYTQWPSHGGDLSKLLYKVINSLGGLHVYNWGGIYYFGRPIPYNVRQFYSASRISFSLKAKSLSTALCDAKSVRQKLDEYCMVCKKQINYEILNSGKN